MFGSERIRLMRKPGTWMQLPLDERILELLAEEPALQPKTIAEEFQNRTTDVSYHANPIGDRCRALESRGLLYKTGVGVYSITDEGRAYLDGELDAAQLEETE